MSVVSVSGGREARPPALHDDEARRAGVALAQVGADTHGLRPVEEHVARQVAELQLHAGLQARPAHAGRSGQGEAGGLAQGIKAGGVAACVANELASRAASNRGRNRRLVKLMVQSKRGRALSKRKP